ncbi:hypothetical protein FPZ42_12900 [Mucilaginibacter achroorhodeus]|uniref:Uncharacterized protein n=1 Tax=Mucilaginibacter achroorhodeus TaxID=2599294 RepID=A0A563U2D3_9SPHI|nr:hypothetical protein [Mucilaginibacter achroorhodeus]TWR25491.1 hypothetical protein FPZ42_12900 [Mucilaginibacter achroorhodeus]
MGKLEISAEFDYFIEGTHLEADDILEGKIPELLEGLSLKITYQDEQRNEHVTQVSIRNQEIFNEY